VQLVQFKKLENGNLRISLIEEERSEVEEISQNGKGIDAQFIEIIEHQLCNGWDMIKPEEIAALTSAPILSDSAIYDDRGILTGIDEVWWYPNYAIFNEVEELLEHGYIDFDLGEEYKEDAA
jgi:hypothetical protein